MSYKYTIDWEFSYFTSDIVEIKNITEDLKYRLMDEYEKLVQAELSFDQRDYTFDVKTAYDLNDIERQKFLTYHYKTVDQRVEVFKSYKEASESRQLKID